jgi:hypothetical protein
VVQAVLLRPLEYPAADRLARINGLDEATGEVSNLSPADFLDFQRDAASFSRMGANGFVGLATLTGGQGEPGSCGRRAGDRRFLPDTAGATGTRPHVPA